MKSELSYTKCHVPVISRTFASDITSATRIPKKRKLEKELKEIWEKEEIWKTSDYVRARWVIFLSFHQVLSPESIIYEFDFARVTIVLQLLPIVLFVRAAIIRLRLRFTDECGSTQSNFDAARRSSKWWNIVYFISR